MYHCRPSHPSTEYPYHDNHAQTNLTTGEYCVDQYSFRGCARLDGSKIWLTVYHGDKQLVSFDIPLKEVLWPWGKN